MSADAAPPGPPFAGAVAIGWATVELDRAATELAGLVAEPFVAAPGSDLLGAACRIAAAADGSARSIVLLEPSTEGRLAATLARHGEGWVARWFGSGAAPASAGWSVALPGPFGTERLAIGGPIGGPHVLRLDGDTIDP